MSRLATWVLVGCLLSILVWIQGAIYGYSRGKDDAQASLAPYGVVVLHPDKTCLYYETSSAVVGVQGPVRAHLTMLLKPNDDQD